jgi:peptidoglycan DL-endopeptidase CwlO
MPIPAPARQSPVRRKVARLAGLAVAAVAVGMVATLIGTGTAVSAGPNPYAGVPILAQQTDLDEGGSADLRKQLDAASKGFIDAKAALEKSTKRQKQLAELVKTLDTDVAEKTQLLSELASRAYRTGRLGPVSALLSSGSENFVDRAAALDAVAANEDRALRSLQESREQQTRAKAAIDAEVAEEKKQVEVMAKRKQQAERALAAVSAGPSGGFSGGNSSSAQPAPRNPDGSWPNESCSQNDPTTSGCITPRTLHALRQAQAAGFKRFVSCFRSGGSGEHPKGRACDFAAQPNGFGGTATGGDRTYGNNLANYYVNNASRLGVLYVIWFRQIWLPSSGWRAYNGGGDPSSDHTNHVHLSMH